MGIDLDVSFCHCDSLKSDRKEKVRDPKEGKIKKSQKPNLLINLTYLGVTTLAKQGSRHPKRRLNVR